METLEARQLLAADLHVSIAPVPAEIRETQELSYVVSIRNEGDDDAFGANVQIPKPALENVAWSRVGPTSFPPELESGGLDGSNGLIVRGNAGRVIGDVNGDQIEDWAFSDYDSSTFEQTDFVIFGAAVQEGTVTIGRSDLDGTNGFSVETELENVRGAGDLNGDGFDDMFIGDRIVFGRADLGASGELSSSDSSGEHGFRWDGITRRARVSAAGDFNGDGFDDVAVSDTDFHSSGGGVWIVYGKADLDRNSFQRITLTSPIAFGTGAFFSGDGIEGFGAQVQSGDFNNDGFSDIAIGTDNITLESSVRRQRAYVVLGGPTQAGITAMPRSVEANPSQNVILFYSDVERVRWGAVAGVFDINSDGFDDLNLFGNNVVFGNAELADGFSNSRFVDVALLDGSDGFHTNDRISAVVDINADGIQDLVSEELKQTYVTFGSEESFLSGEPEFVRPALNGNNGFGIDLDDIQKDFIVGDFNNDGRMDLALSNWDFENPQTNILFGTDAYKTVGVDAVEEVIDIPAGGEITYGVSGSVPIGASALSLYAEAKDVGIDGIDVLSFATSDQTSVLDAIPDPEVDLVVKIQNNFEQVVPFDAMEYTITIENRGPGYAIGANVVADFDDNLSSISWTRVQELETVGEGPINESFNLPAGQTITYTVTGVVDYQVLNEFVSSVAVTTSAQQTDIDPSNNSAMERETAPLRSQQARRIAHTDICFESTGRLGDELYFVGWNSNDGRPCSITRAQASSGFYGGDLWKTDGTFEGTQLVKQIRPLGPRDPGLWDAFSSSTEFTELNGVLYFAAHDGTHGEELWRTDGTESGTYLVKDINPIVLGGGDPFSEVHAPQGSEISSIVAVDDHILFTADDGTGRRLWESDGTESGTVPADGQELPIIEEQSETQVRYTNGRFEQLTSENTWSTVAVVSADPSLWRAGPLVADEYLIYSQGDEIGRRNADLFALDLAVDSVDAGGPYTLSDSVEQTTSYATQVIHWTTTNSYNKIPVPVFGFGDLQNGVVSTDAVLGNASEYLTLINAHEITVTFPQAIVDLPGNDIVIAGSTRFFGDGEGPFEVHLLDGNGKYQFAGTDREIDLSNYDIVSPIQGVRVVGTISPFVGNGTGTDIQSIQANIAASRIVLTAEATNNLDLQYSWDLNDDGVFGDRIGKSIGLTAQELLDFGLTEVGVYPITVRMTDRVNEYFDTTTLTIPGKVSTPLVGDIDLDGRVAFSDFLILSANFGKSENASPSDGDLDEDGRVTFADFLLLSANFGAIDDV